MIRLICADLDGTLIGSHGVVHPAIWEAATRARAAGLRLAICSGRPAFGLAREYAERLDAEGWHIFQNGASVLQLRSGEAQSASFPEATIAWLKQRAHDTGRVLELYSDHDYVVEVDSPHTRGHAALLGVPFRARPLDSLGAPVVRAQWLLTRDRDEGGARRTTRGDRDVAVDIAGDARHTLRLTHGSGGGQGDRGANGR